MNLFRSKAINTTSDKCRYCILQVYSPDVSESAFLSVCVYECVSLERLN